MPVIRHCEIFGKQSKKRTKKQKTVSVAYRRLASRHCRTRYRATTLTTIEDRDSQATRQPGKPGQQSDLIDDPASPPNLPIWSVRVSRTRDPESGLPVLPFRR